MTPERDEEGEAKKVQHPEKNAENTHSHTHIHSAVRVSQRQAEEMRLQK